MRSLLIISGGNDLAKVNDLPHIGNLQFSSMFK